MTDRYTYKRWILAILVLAALGHGSIAWALEATISARYRGEVQGRFENTTPQAGFCVKWPNDCIGVETIGLPIEFSKTAIAHAPDSRDQFFVQLPSSRTVNVSHAVTGEIHALIFEITHVSQWLSDGRNTNPTFTIYIAGGCDYKRAWGSHGFTQYLWTVKNPSSPSACNSSNTSSEAGLVTQSEVRDMGIGYSLKMPSALKMKQGLYRGSVDFSVGPGGDFDFGNGVTDLNDTRLTLNFEVDVQHAFVLQFPPGSDRAVLEPPGGWQAWLGGRALPPRLERDIPFRLWSTGPFTVYMRCNVKVGDHCGIINREGDTVVVDVSLDLPPEVRHQGKPVRRLSIPWGSANPLGFEHVLPASNRPANLHFEVSGGHVGILAQFPGTTFEGIVTLVFDSDL